MNRLLRATPLLALLAAACSDELPRARELPAPVEEDETSCEGLTPLALTAKPSRTRVGGAVTLTATGGSGHYTYRAEMGGSSGEVLGARFVSGHTPATDTLVVQDSKCPGDARATVEVVAAFDVAPARASLRPGTSFRVTVDGLLGNATFSLSRSGSGATLTPEGVYTAGTTEGLDLITVRDSQTGDEAVLQYDVLKAARLVGDPAYLAVPSGGAVPLATRGGSDRVSWTKVSGPGTLANGRISFASTETGATVLEAADPFTGDKATVAVRVLDELTRPLLAHGRTTDVATMVTADFDGDGAMDLAVGQRESDLTRPQGGAVFIFRGGQDGLSAQPSWVLTGDSDTAQFGDVLAAGDVDGDGRAELVVSSPGADTTGNDSGAVSLYSFQSGAPLPLRQPLTGVQRGAAFGAGMAIADLDGDGDLDLVVGSPLGDLAPTANLKNRGVVDLYLLSHDKPVADLPEVRLGGADLLQDGSLVSRSGTELGRAVVVSDFNKDGRVDVAALSKVSRYSATDGSVTGTQMAVSVFFARSEGARFRSSPDLYVLPANTSDSNEGTWRLGAIPAEGSRPPLLLVISDRADSPDLSASGGVRSGTDAGGALLFDLSDRTPTGDPAAMPPQVTREAAYARIYGDASGIYAGRSWAVLDVDGNPGLELLLGAPYAAAPAGGSATLRYSGKVLVYPLSALSKGSVVNKPASSLNGAAKSEVLGAGLTTWSLPTGQALVAFSGRASSEGGAFTGRVDLFRRSGASLTDWTRSGVMVPSKPSVERFGEALAVTKGTQNRVLALIGAPGWSGPGTNADGADLAVGRAYLYDASQPTTHKVADEGAGGPSKAGKNVGVDVAYTDFNGDGVQDQVVGASAFYVPPGTNAEVASTYATVRPECVTTGTLSVGGVLVSLGQADGTFKPAHRLWAPTLVPGCTPETDNRCKRSAIGRGVVGGFDFNGDGKQDIGVLREKGFELYLGRGVDDASLTKLSMGCDPVYSWPSMALQTSMPVALGDLNGDSCAEVAWRYAEGSRSGVAILMGYDAGGARCGGRTTPAVIRIAGDSEKLLNNLGLGLAIARVGRFLGDTRDFLAISASTIPVDGVTQPAVLLYETAQVVKKWNDAGKPAELVVGALNDGLVPVPLVHRTRAVGFGTTLVGGRDLTGDGVPDLIVGAPGASVVSDGEGAVFVYAGGAQSKGSLSPFLTVVGDGTERSLLGQDLALTPEGTAPMLLIGAPRSYRTGTQNGTAYSLPLGL